MPTRITRHIATASDSLKVAFTFDVEEDWEESPYPLYYDSYHYMDSGAFRELVNGLSDRDIAGTFYVTPNVARDRPDELRYLEQNGHRIGAHLHVHDLFDLQYPCAPGEEDNITFYDYRSKSRLIGRTKRLLDSVLARPVVLYRSGRYACDGQVEEVVRNAGFLGIANHTGVFPIEHLKMWNLGGSSVDLFSSQCASVEKCVNLFETWKNHEKFVVFSAHPMLLYDRRKGMRTELLSNFLEFVTILQSKYAVEVTEQHEILRKLAAGVLK